MKIKVIATGSKGNSYTLENASGNYLLIDAGVHKSEVLKAINYEPSKLSAILITHEHGDHAKHVREFELIGRPMILSKGTRGALKPNGWVVEAKSGEAFKADGFTVLPFRTIHDAADPLGFLIKADNEKLIFATDTRALPVKTKGINTYMVECNWDGETLRRSEDPTSLKERVTDTHMGLSVLKDFFLEEDLSATRQIVLIHASSRNLNKEKAVREIQELTGVPTYMAFNGFEITT